MNSIAPFELSVDSDLQQALERAAGTVQKSFADLEMLKNGFNPIQSFMEVSQQVAGLYSSINWFNTLQPSVDFSVFQSSMAELLEIQKASIEQLTEVQKKMFQDTVLDVQNTASAAQPGQSPQQNLAAAINASLDGYEKLQSDFGDQTQVLNSINAAYMAWLQKTMQGLNKQ